MSIFDKFKDVFKKTKDIVEDKLEDVSEVVVEKAGDLKTVVSEKMEDMEVHDMIANAKEKANKTAENIKGVVSQKLDDANAALDNMKAKSEDKKESFSFPDEKETAIDADLEFSDVIYGTTEKSKDLVEHDDDILDLLPIEDTTPTTTDLTVKTAEQSDQFDELFDEISETENKTKDVKDDIQDQATILLEGPDDTFDMAIDTAKEINRTIDIDSPVETKAESTDIPSSIPTNEKGEMKDHLSALLEESDAFDRAIKAAQAIGDMAQKKVDIIENPSSEDRSDVIDDAEVVEEEKKDKKKDGGTSFSDLVDDAKDTFFGF